MLKYLNVIIAVLAINGCGESKDVNGSQKLNITPATETVYEGPIREVNTTKEINITEPVIFLTPVKETVTIIKEVNTTTPVVVEEVVNTTKVTPVIEEPIVVTVTKITAVEKEVVETPVVEEVVAIPVIEEPIVVVPKINVSALTLNELLEGTVRGTNNDPMFKIEETRERIAHSYNSYESPTLHVTSKKRGNLVDLLFPVKKSMKEFAERNDANDFFTIGLPGDGFRGYTWTKERIYSIFNAFEKENKPSEISDLENYGMMHFNARLSEENSYTGDSFDFCITYMELLVKAGYDINKLKIYQVKENDLVAGSIIKSYLIITTIDGTEVLIDRNTLVKDLASVKETKYILKDVTSLDSMHLFVVIGFKSELNTMIDGIELF